jgi:phosphoglycerate dehydrogenase-like enzyme
MADPIEVLITIPFSDEVITHLKTASAKVKIRHQIARKPEEINNDIWAKIQVLYTDRILPQPALVPNLKWIQFHYAGIDFAADNELLKIPGLSITTMSGTSASQAAEYVIMMMLALGHKLPEMIYLQNRKEWPKDRWDRFNPLELRGSTVGLVGYGSIGRQVARLLQPFGVKILAAKRDVLHPEDHGYIPDGMGDPGGDFFTRLYPIQALKSMLKECDFVIICTPLTPQTRNLLGEEELEACKTGSFLINPSRGEVVDQNALVKALQDKHLAGAALDVFQQEPLPPDHVLWSMPNVIISPHIAGNSLYYNDRAMTLFTENLSRYQNNEPLLNLYHLEQEY